MYKVLLKLMKRRFVLFFILLLSSVSLAAAADNIRLDTIFLKVGVLEGSSVTKSITITNLREDSEIRLDLVGVEGTLEKYQLKFLDGDTETVDLTFNASKLRPGIYTGSMKLSGVRETKMLPIILEVESKDLFFDVNLDVAPRYSQVRAGDTLVIGVKIFDLTGSRIAGSLDPTSVRLEYTIYDIEGNALVSETETVVVSRQAELTKTLRLPDNVNPGDYFVGVEVRYITSLGTSSYLFNVEEPPIVLPTPEFSTRMQTLLVGAALLLVLIAFLYVQSNRRRDRLLSELVRYNSAEIQRQKQLLTYQEQALRLKKPKASTKRIKDEIKRKIEELKKKHKFRINNFKKIKDVTEMRRKLKDWKAAGYSTTRMGYKLKGLTTAEMKRIMSKWRKKGYK